MENSKANVYTCFPITFGFSISKVLTHCNICWMQTNTFFQFRLYANWILFSFIFFLIIWFKSVLSLSPRRLVPWQLTCAVWCLVGFEGSNLPYRKKSQLPVIWPKSFRFGLLEEMRALWYDVCVFCHLFGIVFQQTLYIQFGRIAIWYLLGTCWKQMVFPQSEVSWVFRCGNWGWITKTATSAGTN